MQLVIVIRRFFNLIFDLAKDKIMMGPERKSMILTEDQKRLTAYHEARQAIVGRLVPEHDPVYKVTIIPRGRALGVTMFLPEEDRYMQSKEYLLSRICALYGGRIAEQIINGDRGITTGASMTLRLWTNIATNMVTKWGLSDSMGPLKYGEDESSPLGRSASMPSQPIVMILHTRLIKRLKVSSTTVTNEFWIRF